MDKTVKIVGAAFLVGVLLFLAPLFGIGFGAFAGWIAGLFYPNTLHLLGQRIGLPVEPWQLGAMLGFVGGFFKSSLAQKSSD